MYPSLPCSSLLSSNGDLGDWLADKLREERAQISKHFADVERSIEKRHCALLAEVASRVNVSPSPPVPLVTCRKNEHMEMDTLQTTGDSGTPKEAWVADQNGESGLLSSNLQEQIPKMYSSKMLASLGGSSKTGTRFQQAVQSLWFEVASGMLILANTMIMALEIQYQGLESGYFLQHLNYNQPAKDAWPGAEDAFTVLEVLFNLAFAVELILRTAADPRGASRSFAIWLDVVLVVSGVVFTTSHLLGASLAFFNPTMIRVVRLVRIVRMIKMVRSVRAFDSLYLILRSIQASVGALFWSFVLLFMIQTMVGMFFSQMLRTYIDDTSQNLEARRKVFGYWGTFTRTMITMFEVTLANWATSCRVLIDNVSEAYGVAYILYRCMFCFAVVRVIAAVFITETNRVTANDDEMAILRSRRTAARQLQKLRDFFAEVDLNGDGWLSWSEFQQALDDPLVKQWLTTLGVEMIELEDLFDLMDDGDGQISMDEFITGVNKLKGQARSVDLVNVLTLVKRLSVKVDRLTSSPPPPSLPFPPNHPLCKEKRP